MLAVKKDMDEILQRLSSLLEPCKACGPASQRQIETAQVELALLFPPSYRWFLEKYGAVLGHGFEISGLTPSQGNEQPMWSDMLSSTIVDRSGDALPDDSIYISTDGTDLRYFLKCSRTDPTHEGEVIEWGPDNDGGVIYAKSFVLFVERRFDR